MLFEQESTATPSNISIEESQTAGNASIEPIQAIVVAFYVGRVISILSIVLGIPGNVALIVIICRSSFYRFSNGLLLLCIATFDIVRLASTIFYYLIFANIIPLNTINLTIYVAWFRYPKNVTNWLKVFLAIERLVAVSHAMIHRYNIRSKTTTAEQRGRQRRILLLILLLLVCSFISQHLNFIPDRFISPSVDPIRFVLLAVPNPNFRYGPIAFNAIAYAIVSSVLLDDVLPVTALIILNSILLYRLRQLPLSISGKLVESIWILFFLTLFSIFVTPRSMCYLLDIYVDPHYVNRTATAIIFHMFQGLEMANHALTGYTCFVTCESLRLDLFKSLREARAALCKAVQRKGKQPTAYAIELSEIVCTQL